MFWSCAERSWSTQRWAFSVSKVRVYWINGWLSSPPEQLLFFPIFSISFFFVCSVLLFSANSEKKIHLKQSVCTSYCLLPQEKWSGNTVIHLYIYKKIATAIKQWTETKLNLHPCLDAQHGSVIITKIYFLEWGNGRDLGRRINYFLHVELLCYDILPGCRGQREVARFHMGVCKLEDMNL